MDLSKLSEKEQRVVLEMTNYLAAKFASQNSETGFNDYPADEQDLEQAAEQAKQLASARKDGRSGRVYVDNSAEGREVREQVRRFLRRSGRIK